MTGTGSRTDETPSFGYGDHMLLWAWRRAAAGDDAASQLDRELGVVCGEDAAEVLATLGTFVRALGFASRRMLSIGAPGSPAITPDERQVLTLLAAAQADVPALFEANMRWLALPDRRDVLEIAAGALASALAANGLALSVPADPGASVCERTPEAA